MLVARWLFDAAPVLIVNDVSVGVDVGSREEIYRAIRREAAAGAAVLVITSDFEEIEALCTRALVFARGCLQGRTRRHGSERASHRRLPRRQHRFVNDGGGR